MATVPNWVRKHIMLAPVSGSVLHLPLYKSESRTRFGHARVREVVAALAKQDSKAQGWVFPSPESLYRFRQSIANRGYYAEDMDYEYRLTDTLYKQTVLHLSATKHSIVLDINSPNKSFAQRLLRDYKGAVVDVITDCPKYADKMSDRLNVHSARVGNILAMQPEMYVSHLVTCCPLETTQAIRWLCHCLKFLHEGSTLVAVVPDSLRYHQDLNCIAFRRLLSLVGGCFLDFTKKATVVEDLYGSKLFCCLVKINSYKPLTHHNK